MTARIVTSDRLPPRTRIGDYEVVEELEVEEAGVVYLATHVMLPRQVCLKVMHSGSAWLRAIAIKVLREACLLEALHHPGIPRVYECGVLPDRRPWTAFERIDGTTIAESMRSGPLSVADVVVLLRDIADVLAHAHGRGVVHRQLVADAIVRSQERTFGFAVTHWDNALTLDTTRVATDPRDDVFALGVIAFRALSGSMPDVQATADCVPWAPAELAVLIDQMLANEPVARPTSAEVRDRARWLSVSMEQVSPLLIDKSRWTPPPGSLADKVPVISDDGFAIRISRPRSSS